MPSRSLKTELKAEPTFVFKGTVQATKSSTMKEVPVDDRTLVATVDQILEAPPGLAKLEGQKITVRLSSRKKVKAGQEIMFHAVSWIYGESVAVQSLKEEPVKASHLALLAAPADPVEQHRQRMKQKRFDQAALVVSGKVTAVRMPEESQAETRAPGILGTQRKPISEHDPKWREAIVEVGEVHKGTEKKKQVVVRFPASTDVMWYQAPKFQPGQQGYFMLHKPATPTKPDRKRSLLAADVGPTDVYTVTDRDDFQPFDESGGVKAIISSAGKKKRR